MRILSPALQRTARNVILLLLLRLLLLNRTRDPIRGDFVAVFQCSPSSWIKDRTPKPEKTFLHDGDDDDNNHRRKS
jgi:hypothetical protein